MKILDVFKREQFDLLALQALVRERFPAHPSEIASGVLAILHGQFRTGSKYLVADARLVDDLGFDDMDFVELLKVIEKDFAIQFDAEDFEQDSTLDDLIELTARKSVQQSPAGYVASRAEPEE